MSKAATKRELYTSIGIGFEAGHITAFVGDHGDVPAIMLLGQGKSVTVGFDSLGQVRTVLEELMASLVRAESEAAVRS